MSGCAPRSRRAAAQPLTLVLDDYHVIHAAPIHELIASTLAYVPTQLRLIIASRSDPPLPLPRLRAHGWLAELRASDLTFTYEETVSSLFSGEKRSVIDGPFAETRELSAGFWLWQVASAAHPVGCSP